MTVDSPKPRARMIPAVLTIVFMVGAGLIGGALAAQAAPLQAAQATRAAAAAPCASQGSCGYCGVGGIWTGNCTRAKLEYNVAWCGRNKAHLNTYNKAKCKAEAGYLSSGPTDQLLPWLTIICSPLNARTIYLFVSGLAEKTGWVGVACAGIGVYAGLHSLLFKIIP
jgi:hypothetical protein